MESNSTEAHEIFKKYAFLIAEDGVLSTQNIILNEVGFLSQNLKEFASYQHAVTCSFSVIVPKLAELIVNFGLVKSFQESEDRDYGSDDFPHEAANAAKCFEYLNNLVPYYVEINTASKRNFLVQVLLLCATHNKIYLWSSEESVSLSKEFLENLLDCSKHKTLNGVLCDDMFHPTIFKAILKKLRPSLMKDTWMKNPSSCHVFYWLLFHVKHPHLLDYLYDVLPPAFMFTSYYAEPQQVLGIQCFNHILENVPPSLIKADGIEDAMYDTLKKFIYQKDVPLVEILYPCLLKLPMMNLQKVNQLKWLQFDIILQQLLINVDMESNAKLRHLFLSQMHLFVKATPCFKHLKKTMHTLLHNFVANSIEEEKCRIISLKIIEEVIRSCWPRIENYCLEIMLAVLKAIYDIENPSYTSDGTTSKEILTLCESCLHLLNCACPKTFKNLVEEYLQDDDSMPGACLLKSIAQAT